MARREHGSPGKRGSDAQEAVAARLRQGLVDELISKGYIDLDDRPLEEAFRAVPRHLFVAGVADPGYAYRDEVIPLKPGASTVSQPSVVAIMLKGLELEPRLKVLEIGTASGYSAALLAELVGPEGKVYTVEIDPQLAQQARQALDRAGYPGVEVRAGDGSLGLPEEAPFDRIVITATTARISPQLVEQLAVGGVLLTPFNLPGLPSLLLRLRKEVNPGEAPGRPAHLDHGDLRLAGEFVGVPVCFVPLRGAYRGDDRRGADSDVLDPDGGRALARALALVLRRMPGLPLDEQMGLGLMGVWKYREAAERIDEDTILNAWRAEGRPGLKRFGVEVAPEALRLKQAVDLEKLRIFVKSLGNQVDI
ncbi:MAG: protein-L-isoaspartate O-methyltransferase [Firmicutes bacterium]|nr:protein-L-isoaspartate O-methyltransferase [Bacillota bacterium]